MLRVADYIYAAPSGLDALVVGEFASEADAIKAVCRRRRPHRTCTDRERLPADRATLWVADRARR
jgi:hypothetical protein